MSKLAEVIGILLAIGDVASDFFYITTYEFYSEDLKFAALFFLILSNGTIYLFGCVYFIFYCYKKHFKIYLILWILFGPILAPFCPILFGLKKMTKNKEDWKFLLLKYTECINESLPQLIIQGMNNTLTNNWSILSIVSSSLSLISVLKGIYHFTSFIDNYNKREVETEINLAGCCESPSNFFKFIQILPMLAFWALNIFYLFLKFDDEKFRAILLGLIFGQYAYALFGRHCNSEKVGFLKVFKICYISHFNEFLKMCVNINYEYIWPSLQEFIFMILIIASTAIEIYNCIKVGEYYGMYAATIITNIVCLFISILRIIDHKVTAAREKQFSRVISFDLSIFNR